MTQEATRQTTAEEVDQTGRDPDSLLEKGRAAFAEGDFRAAVAHADEALSLDPASSRAVILKAQALTRLSRSKDATGVLRDAIAAHDDTRVLRFARSFVHEHGRPDEALDYALTLAEREPHDEKNRAFLGQMYLVLEAPESALAQANAMIGSGSPKLGPMLKAQALAKLDRRDEALETLQVAVAEDGDDPKVLRMARTIAFENGAHAQAIDFAERLSKFEPDELANQVFLIQSFLASGQFERALGHAEDFVAAHPAEPDGAMLKAQALVATHRVDDALRALGGLDQNQPAKLLRVARSIALQNGRFDAAIEYSLKLLAFAPGDVTNHVFLLQAYIASDRIREAEEHLSRFASDPELRQLKKMSFYLRHLRKLAGVVPAVVQAWTAALNNCAERPRREAQLNRVNATMIQYWSQGELPADVAIVHDSWQELFQREALGSVELFNRTSAGEWIEANAPEFATAFDGAFHYAMESDIFRIAYASKRPCIYMDIDSWPLEDAADILRFGVASNSTMLYLRAYRPWVLNGFFVSTPESAFMQELVRQTLEVRVDELPKNHETIENSFGPSRYNKVLLDLVEANSAAQAALPPNARGCSYLTIGDERLYFTHEAAVASVKPPFPLGYKTTDDYWKGVSIPA